MAGRHWYLAGLTGLSALSYACTSSNGVETSLSKTEQAAPPEVGPIPKDNPKLGAIADVTPVFEKPAENAQNIGYLHAGATVPRAKQPYPGDGCDGGWYPIRPRGFVCVGPVASLDTKHPTLAAMSLLPDMSQALPFTYARTAKETPLFTAVKQRDDAVKQVGKLRARSGLAIVGSWQARDEAGEMQRLGLMPNGLFVRAQDLEAVRPSEFAGVELNEQQVLPVGFVVKQGVHFFKLEKNRPEKDGPLGYHERVALSGRFRTVDSLKYWATTDGRWVRHRDVTVIRRLHDFPDFAAAEQKWIDVSIVTGTLVLYEGKKPVFASLLSVGRDRLGDPKTTASTAQGVFEVVEKHITDRGLDPKASEQNYEVYDVPWVLTLAGGTRLHAAFWHDRFGIEHTDGALHVSPKDAARIFAWSTPELPEGWHAIKASGQKSVQKTMVRVRK